MFLTHPIPPVFDERSEILILGSFPSAQSRTVGFFYGHPQNRFWQVLAAVYDEALPRTVEEKKTFLINNRIALWDVIASCQIDGSADSSIRGAVPNPIGMIMEKAPIKRIFVNGRCAETLYRKYLFPQTGIPAAYLPSTSPANAAKSTKKLYEDWKILREADNFEKNAKNS